MNSETEILKLMAAAERDIKADNLKGAGEKLHQATQIAQKLGNEPLIKQIWETVEKYSYTTNTQSLELDPIETDGLILDIGGGGRGIIGMLNGRQVVAIDRSERELRETRNEALKVVMDATDLQFLSDSFDVCTAFFSLMYIPNDQHLTVFEEVYRVLKQNGRFRIWDTIIPKKRGDYKIFLVRLKVTLPTEEIAAEYGVKWNVQNVEHFKELAKKVNFKRLNHWSTGEVFFLELVKKG
jgi:ubiquinone/menaquinone biosynthesis C-methylase UbiE